MKKIILIILLVNINFSYSYAIDINSTVNEKINEIDFSQIDSEIQKYNGENPLIKSISFKNIVKAAIDGNMKEYFGEILEIISKQLLKEIKANFDLVGKILIICILGQILYQLMISFDNSSIGEIGFFVTYMVLAALIIKSFNITIYIEKSCIDEIRMIMKAIIPSLTSLLALSGKYSTAIIVNEVILICLEYLLYFIQDIFLPFVKFICIVEIVNNISKKPVFKHFLNTTKKMCNLTLKICVGVFIFIMGLQTVTSPVTDTIINKTTKYAFSSIPVVGGTVSGVVDTFLDCSRLIKNGVGVGAIVLLLIYCIIPVIKLIVIFFVYKLTASIIQPLTENRTVEVLSATGDYVAIILGALVTCIVIFIASIAIMIGITGAM